MESESVVIKVMVCPFDTIRRLTRGVKVRRMISRSRDMVDEDGWRDESERIKGFL